MEIDLSVELIAALFAGLIAALLTLVGGITMAARALGAQTKTNIALNNELQEAIKDRRASETDRDDLRDQIKTLTTNQERIEAAFSALSAEYASVKMALAAAQKEAVAMQESIRALTQAIADAAAREQKLMDALKDARDRICTLEQEGRAKDVQIKSLTARVNYLEDELKAAQAARKKLEVEKALLEAQIAALTARPIELSEHAPDVPEKTEDITETKEE